MRRPLLAIAAWCFASVMGAARAESSDSIIYVARRGWHLDVGFDISDLKPPLAVLATQFSGAKFLFFGFGDRHYLLAKSHGGPELLGALWPGAGLILVTALPSPPAEAFKAGQVVELKVSSRQVREAQQFIFASFAERRLIPPPSLPGPYPGSLFYEATPTYSGVHTCNTWVAESLRAAALPVHSGGVIFAGQLWRQVTRLSNRPLQSSIAH